MELAELLERIRSKIVLDLELTEYERGMWILYGDPKIKISIRG